jgi:hypothetical protein
MAFKVICKLPNASTNINGVAFERVGEHVHSVDELSDEQLDHFASIAGFEVVDTDAEPDSDQSQDQDDSAESAQDASAPKPAPRRARK